MAASSEDTALTIGLLAGILGGLAGLAVLFILLGKFCSCISCKKCKCEKKKKEEKKEEDKKEEEKKEEDKKEEAAGAPEEKKDPTQPEEVKPEELVYRREPEAAPVVPIPVAVPLIIPGQVQPVQAAPVRRDSLPPIKRLPKKGISFGGTFDVGLVEEPPEAPPQYNLYEYEVNRPIIGHSGQFQYKSLYEPQKFHYKEVQVHGYVKDAMDIV